MTFLNRRDAGKKLAIALAAYTELPDTVVIGLPRGGVITAFEVAKALHLPLDIICPRKVGAPDNPELALGAVTHTGEGFFNREIITSLGVSHKYLEEVTAQKKKESLHYLKLFRKNRPPLILKGKTALIIDDGLATGATMKAAIQWAKKERAKKIVVAVPAGPLDTLQELSSIVDDVVCLISPPFFHAVGQCYKEFTQTEDAEVIACLENIS